MLGRRSVSFGARSVKISVQVKGYGWNLVRDELKKANGTPHVVKHILTTNMKQPMRKVCIRQLETIVYRPQRRGKRVRHSREPTTRCCIRLKHDQRLPRLLRQRARVRIRFTKLGHRIVPKIIRKHALWVCDWGPCVESRCTVIIRVAVNQSLSDSEPSQSKQPHGRLTAQQPERKSCWHKSE